MSRLKRPTTESKNPATKFLSWRSNDKNFSYYDKDKGENIPVELPLKFLFLEHYHTVKGWNDASESGIYSNEVYSIGSEELTVKAFKGGDLGAGLYKNIKNDVKNNGGVYHRSIYVMLEDGSIANLSLKGSAVASYSEFYNDNNHLLDNQWIIVDDAIEGKKGSIKFSKPSFTIGDVITRAVDKKAVEAAQTLQSYMNDYTSKEVETEKELVDDLDL